MRKFRLTLVLFLILVVLIPVDSAYGDAKFPTLVNTITDPQSKHTAKYETADHSHCTAILITASVALTAAHCGGPERTTQGGTIYPGGSGMSTPFGYMNISDYIPHPDYDIAIIKGTENDKTAAYKYYIKDFKTNIDGFTDLDLVDLIGQYGYSYGYPYKFSGYKQYRTDGVFKFYYPFLPILTSDMYAAEGQSGSGVFLKNTDRLVGIIITRSAHFEANVLPITQNIAQWIKSNM